MWDELYFILCIEQSLLDKTIFKAWLPFWRIFMYVFLFIFYHIFSSNKTLYLSFDQKSVSKNIGNMVDIGDLNHFFFFIPLSIIKHETGSHIKTAVSEGKFCWSFANYCSWKSQFLSKKKKNTKGKEINLPSPPKLMTWKEN